MPVDRSRYWRLSSFYFAYFAVLGSFTPYWSLWLNERGLSPWWIALLMGLSWGTRVLAPPIWGAATAASSRPIRCLQAGCALTLLCFVGFLGDPGLFLLVVITTAFTFFYNAVLPQFEVVTLSHLGDGAAAYGRIRLWGSFGFIAAVACMGLMLDTLPISWLPWLMLPLVAMLALSAFGNEYGAGHGATPDEPKPALGPVLRSTPVLGFLGICLLMQAAHGPFYVFYSLHLEQLGYSRGSIGQLWALGVAAEIAMFLLLPRWLDRIGAARILLLCMAIAVVRWLLVAGYSQSLSAALLAQLMHAFTFGAFHAAAIQIVSRLFRGRLAGHGQGLFYGIGSGAGGVLGALVAGQAWTWGGGPAAFAAAAAMAAAGLLLALLTWRQLGRQLLRN